MMETAGGVGQSFVGMWPMHMLAARRCNNKSGGGGSRTGASSPTGSATSKEGDEGDEMGNMGKLEPTETQFGSDSDSEAAFEQQQQQRWRQEQGSLEDAAASNGDSPQSQSSLRRQSKSLPDLGALDWPDDTYYGRRIDDAKDQDSSATTRH